MVVKVEVLRRVKAALYAVEPPKNILFRFLTEQYNHPQLANNSAETCHQTRLPLEVRVALYSAPLQGQSTIADTMFRYCNSDSSLSFENLQPRNAWQEA